VVTGYYQQRQMTSRTPADAQNQQAQMMGKIFPLFFGFISLNIPAGVVVYFVVSNAWQIGQQAVVFRGLDKTNLPAIGPKGGDAPGPKGQADPGPRGGGTPAKPKPKPPAGSGGNGRGSPRGSKRSRARRGR
jgi:YidC/Oxa1 family membrane protein insertase